MFRTGALDGAFPVVMVCKDWPEIMPSRCISGDRKRQWFDVLEPSEVSRDFMKPASAMLKFDGEHVEVEVHVVPNAEDKPVDVAPKEADKKASGAWTRRPRR